MRAKFKNKLNEEEKKYRIDEKLNQWDNFLNKSKMMIEKWDDERNISLKYKYIYIYS